MTDTTRWTPCPKDLLPQLTYRDLWLGLESISHGRNLGMIPYLVSALREQVPYLTGKMVLFEILRSANCLADEPLTPSHLN